MTEETATIIFSAFIRFSTIGLLVYLIGALVNVQEYYLRIAAYYESRAMSLLLAGTQDLDHATRFARYARVLGAENIQFSKQPPTPTAELIELLKNAQGLSGKKKGD
ncbi:MAG TPA: hypothetical protein VG055_07825 [Planctomycetaceae bacterium]|jgi:cytochrome c biogenesis protein CcdA|nr:hypothetical protein [Planctomycetaceae bacterium]